MSKYTTEIRFICENYAGLSQSVDYQDVNTVLENSWEKVFDFPFPIFDENYRSVLCKKILKHYYTREIGLETVGLWKLKLDAMMNEIMPYYNKMYESELLEFNPMTDADYTKSHEGSNDGTGRDVNDKSERVVANHTGTVTDAGTHGGTVSDAGEHEETIGDVGNEQLSESTWDVYSDTPQGALTNVENNTYLTNARKISHDAETDTTNDRSIEGSDSNLRTYNETNGNTRTYNEHNDTTDTGQNVLNRTYSNTDEYIEHVVGKFPGKSYASLLREFRDTFLNIDLEIIQRLSDLFLKLW